ncbi:guanylate cyclase soluble subunit beta-2-like [Anneissia japonica]|uniref:guanylate cyclase soluble subunit beta-2-like n=1 Tax=Anneissia japonica TaxID=1529436 RepID=UPI0014256720|nr:guanylate cyclase soluble subunit beta-2-like [Anneissia japonica]
MYGFINQCVKSLVEDKFGTEAWIKIRELAEVDDGFISHGCYDDGVTLRLVTAACEVAGLSTDAVLEAFGAHFFTFCQMSGYDEMLRALGGSLKAFLENLDSLHSYLSLSYKEMEAPSFRCEKGEGNALLLHYYSHRKGLHPIVVGIVKAVAKEFFESEVRMKVISKTHEEERNGKKEHVAFAIYQRKVRRVEPGPPKFVAQTKKHSEMHLNKEHSFDLSNDEWEQLLDVDQVMKNIEANKDGLKGSPGRKGWTAIRSLVTLAGLHGNEFTPAYPEKLWMDQQTFCDYFPYHLVFDCDLKVLQAGVHIQRILPRLRGFENSCVNEFFSMVHPQIDWNIKSIQKFINMQFVLETRRRMITPHWGDSRPMLQLRGQMIWMRHIEAMVYICSPRVVNLKELEERHLHLSDIPFHDVTRDLILFNHQRLAEIELGKQLEQKKEELRTAMQELANEKKKTDMLLNSMLPRQVAEQLREGKKVEAGKFAYIDTLGKRPRDSILDGCLGMRGFHFTSRGEIIVKGKGQMSTYFLEGNENATIDEILGRGQTSDTESSSSRGSTPEKGDKAKESPTTPAKKDIRNSANDKVIPMVYPDDIASPDKSKLKPGGNVYSTVDRAPSKGSLRSNCYRCLGMRGFHFTSRGEIIVKGKGQMSTYFLEGNENATIDEILGRGQTSDTESSSSRGSTPEKGDKAKESPTTPAKKDIRNSANDKVIPMVYPDDIASPDKSKLKPGGNVYSTVDRAPSKGSLRSNPGTHTNAHQGGITSIREQTEPGESTTPTTSNNIDDTPSPAPSGHKESKACKIL